MCGVYYCEYLYIVINIVLHSQERIENERRKKMMIRWLGMVEMLSNMEWIGYKNWQALDTRAMEKYVNKM